MAPQRRSQPVGGAVFDQRSFVFPNRLPRSKNEEGFEKETPNSFEMQCDDIGNFHFLHMQHYPNSCFKMFQAHSNHHPSRFPKLPPFRCLEPDPRLGRLGRAKGRGQRLQGEEQRSSWSVAWSVAWGRLFIAFCVQKFFAEAAEVDQTKRKTA